MNWTSPTTAVSTVVGSSHSCGPSGVLTGLCLKVRRILPPSFKALALGSPHADAGAMVAVEPISGANDER
jgi:hypothetical protein